MDFGLFRFRWDFPKIRGTLFGLVLRALRFRWDFSKLRGTLIWGPYNKDPTI